MNNVSLVGRLSSDPRINKTEGGTVIARFNLAVDRDFKKEGQPTADFPPIVAFGKTAENVEKYLKKGALISVVGRIVTGKYDDKDGKPVYTTEVAVEKLKFIDTKTGSNASKTSDTSASDSHAVDTSSTEDFQTPDDLDDDDIPF